MSNNGDRLPEGQSLDGLTSDVWTFRKPAQGYAIPSQGQSLADYSQLMSTYGGLNSELDEALHDT